jgi:hypothetical protein
MFFSSKKSSRVKGKRKTRWQWWWRLGLGTVVMVIFGVFGFRFGQQPSPVVRAVVAPQMAEKYFQYFLNQITNKDGAILMSDYEIQVPAGNDDDIIIHESAYHCGDGFNDGAYGLVFDFPVRKLKGKCVDWQLAGNIYHTDTFYYLLVDWRESQTTVTLRKEVGGDGCDFAPPPIWEIEIPQVETLPEGQFTYIGDGSVAIMREPQADGGYKLYLIDGAPRIQRLASSPTT